MNYKVSIEDGGLRVSPPLREEDRGSSLVLLVDSKYGDVLHIVDRKGALLALYDELQVNGKLKQGDTFTLRGSKEPFARVEGFHVVPVGW